jgi:hypothetical protein
MTFEQAERLFAAARQPSQGKRLRADTYLHKVDDIFVIRLHGKNLVTINRDNTYTLNSGGGLTQTSVDRINRYSTAHLTKRKSVWFLMTGTGRLVAFFDGIQVDRLGQPSARSCALASYPPYYGRTDPPVAKCLIHREPQSYKGDSLLCGTYDCWSVGVVQGVKAAGDPLQTKACN